MIGIWNRFRQNNNKTPTQSTNSQSSTKPPQRTSPTQVTHPAIFGKTQTLQTRSQQIKTTTPNQQTGKMIEPNKLITTFQLEKNASERGIYYDNSKRPSTYNYYGQNLKPSGT